MKRILESVKCLLGFHSWKYFIKNHDRYRICNRCGKIQKEKIVDVGQDEYSYVRTEWRDVKE